MRSMSSSRFFQKADLSEPFLLSINKTNKIIALADRLPQFRIQQSIAMKNIPFLRRYFCSSKLMEKALQAYYKKNDPLPGFCDKTGTGTYRQRNSQVHSTHWRHPLHIEENLSLSSLGIGTQKGAPTPESDLKMFNVLVQALRSGQYVNFRYGKSEKTINAVINYLVAEQGFQRKEFFISTKCGYIPNDIDSNLDERAFKQILVGEKYIEAEDIVNDIHCLHPNFIKFSAEKSLLSLGLDTLDLLYLNNPAESQLPIIGQAEFNNRIELAFEALEQLRANGRIKHYGIASFMSLRSPPNEEGIHMSLQKMADIARKVGGEAHGLRYILLPFNLGMPESLMKWQLDSNHKETNIFEVAHQNHINVNICCPLFQGRVANVPFQSQALNHIEPNASKHLQLVRSLPKPNILTSVFSTEETGHLREDLGLSRHPCLTGGEWKSILPIQE